MQIDVGGARLFFDTVGSKLAIAGEAMAERPTLIVMHGGPGFDHSGMRPYFDRFADTHQVLYLDHRGNGRSTGAPETWTLAQWGRDVKALCDALGIERPHVYGNSFGGMVAMSYAAQFPDHPAKLILSSTAARMQAGRDLSHDGRARRRRGARHRRTFLDRAGRGGDDGLHPRLHAALQSQAQSGRRSPRASARMLRPEVSRHFIMGEMRTMDMRARAVEGSIARR